MGSQDYTQSEFWSDTRMGNKLAVTTRVSNKVMAKWSRGHRLVFELAMGGLLDDYLLYQSREPQRRSRNHEA